MIETAYYIFITALIISWIVLGIDPGLLRRTGNTKTNLGMISTGLFMLVLWGLCWRSDLNRRGAQAG